jgi:hypothetical protein
VDQRVDKRDELVDALHAWQKQAGATFPQGQPRRLSNSRASEARDDQ